MTLSNKHIKIGVIFPSRGLVFSQTADELLQNLKGHLHKIYFSHKLPIPECFEVPTEKALKDPTITHLFFVEDDMILPPDILQQMLDKNVAVVTVNYPTTSRGDSSVLTVKGRIIYGGTGCTLVKREVFNELKKPYFRDDIVWIPKNKGDHLLFTGKLMTKKGYGLHDVNFFINLYQLEIPVHKLDITIGQRKLIALGKAGTNDGAHNIKEWHSVKKDRYFTLRKGLPVAKSTNLTTVISDGKEITVSLSHAKTLIKAGLAVKAPKRAVVIDNSEVRNK